jgi:dTDP-N-acetylfucosamine:lipid II N-acetylfucosaminyltransferase
LAMLNRFSRMATPIEEDHAALHASQPALRIPFLDWNYWTEGFRADAAGPGTTGNDVLLGNSATPANNHLEAIEFLAGVLPAHRRVICPLSYGDERYGDAVEAAGRRMLGDRFIPLRHFMEPAAYSRLIASCSIIVMNHTRQQALGNIILGLCAGARVFLHADSPVRPAMRRLGIEVPSLQELPAFLQQPGPMLPANLGEVRCKLEARFGRASIVRRTGELLDQLRGRREAFSRDVELPA